MNGSILIIGGGGYNKDDPCHGISGGDSTFGYFDYSDIYGGATVRVLDASGTVIGSSALDEGEYLTKNGVDGGDGCRFTFDIPLDAKSTRYQLVLGERQPYDFTDTSDLDLTVGPS